MGINQYANTKLQSLQILSTGRSKQFEGFLGLFLYEKQSFRERIRVRVVQGSFELAAESDLRNLPVFWHKRH